MRRRLPGAGTWVVLAMLSAIPASGQSIDVGDSLRLRLSGRLHVQFSTTSVDSADGEPVPAGDFIIRRARLTFDMAMTNLVSARLEPDYSTVAGVGRLSIKDAFIRLAFAPALRATLGHFKRPFDLFQLATTREFLVAERGGQIRGVEACGRLLTVCSYSNLAVGLLYADRDVGLMLDGDAIPGRLRYAVSLTNGESGLTAETSDGKQVTGRLTVTPLTGLSVSANATSKDYAHPATAAARRALGWGGDVEIGDYDGGLHVQAGIIGGDNWRVARTAPGDTADVVPFVAGQVIAGYRRRVARRWISGLEPVLRASWADPNRTLANDDGWLVTPGLIVHFPTRNMFYVNLDVWLPNSGDTEYALVSQVNVNF